MANELGQMKYNDPLNGSPASAGSQINTAFYQKQALVEAKKLQFFMQLADVTAMPKNFGKTIKRFHYMPLLDDRNMSDQGIDAAGVTFVATERIVSFPALTLAVTNATKAATAAAINDNINSVTKTAQTVAVAGADDSGGTGYATITLTDKVVRYLNSTKSAAVEALNQGVTVAPGYGNLYGSSKDIGAISGKLPALSETGGRVNRVGFKRKELQGSIEKFGFFDEYTQESVDFDNDTELQTHIHREMLNGANEMTEDALMVDVVTSAGVLRYAGVATSKATVDATDLVTYSDLMRLNVDLDNNRCPKHTTISTGTRMIDTRVIPSARIMYTATEMLPTLKAMKDLHNNQAFIGVERYAAGTTTLTGEVGMIDQFRIIIHPEMVRWNGGGAATADGSVYSTNGKVDVFPMVVVGEQSFTTIGFQTDGNTVKFKITHKPPGEANASQLDPYGETGFMSIKWYYGFMVLRPERLAVVFTAAKM